MSKQNGTATAPEPQEAPILERAIADPTQDRNLLLARFGEAQMRLEAMGNAFAEAVAENEELRARLAVFEAAQQTEPAAAKQ